MTPKNTLSKSERLKSKKLTDFLFKKGKSYFLFPFKVYYLLIDSDEHPAQLQFAVSVPKRKITAAVNRNTIKRRAREAYRINKHSLLESLKKENKKLILMFVYLHDRPENYTNIERAIKNLLNVLQSKISA
jgi:ribonuclease P protein component